jgi:hypothetical protein
MAWLCGAPERRPYPTFLAADSMRRRVQTPNDSEERAMKNIAPWLAYDGRSPIRFITVWRGFRRNA